VLPAAAKQLFRHPYRKPRVAAAGSPASRPRLLGGQALAEAQRLSRPRLHSRLFVALLMAADLVALLAGGLLAQGLLPALTGLAWDRLPGHPAAAIALPWVAALLALAMIRLTGGYQLWRMRLMPQSLAHVVPGLVAGLLAAGGPLWALGAATAATPAGLGLWAALSGAAMAAVRVVVWHRLRGLTRLGRLEHRLVVVGGGPSLAPVLQALGQCRDEGYRICGFFDARQDGRSPAVVAGHHKMGSLDSLVDFVRIAQIDTVIVAIPDLSRGRLMEILAVLTLVPVEVRCLAGAGRQLVPAARMSRIGAVALTELCRPPIGDWQALQKRVLDLVAASVALVLLAPVMVAVAVAVRLDSPGPILFRQTRHGFNNKPIRVWKFRSMHADRCDPTAVRAVRRDDDRVTRVGRIIRRTSLDELPQLFNVLSGTLSMVGPRPHATAARTGDILYDEVTAAYSARHRVKPGITGWAQVNGWRGEMNTTEKITERVRHDLHYIENWSIRLDLKILAMTPLALVGGKNAY
jgi:Undecaprenyl-phosphate glucose phosphotransferase